MPDEEIDLPNNIEEGEPSELEVETPPEPTPPPEPTITEKLSGLQEAIREKPAPVAPKVKRDEPSAIDEVNWQLRTLQEFPDAGAPESTFRKVMLENHKALLENGYTGVDALYRAAKEATSDPAVTKEARERQTREAGIERTNRFESPHPKGNNEGRDELKPTAKQNEIIDRLKVTDPEAKKLFVQEIRKEASRLERA